MAVLSSIGSSAIIILLLLLHADASLLNARRVSQADVSVARLARFLPPPLSDNGSRYANATGWNYVGCYVDGVTARSLPIPIPISGGPENMTVTNCLTSAVNLGYAIAGLEYSGECWAGSSVQNNATLAADGEVGCNMACKGNSTEMCGGSNRLSLYQWSGPLPTPPPAASPVQVPPPVAPGPPSVTIPAVPAVPTQNPNVLRGWTHQGCWQDNVGPYGRTLFNQQPDNNNLTQEACVSTCASLGYSIAGMEFYKQCFCDNWIRNNAVLEPLADCNSACSGNTNQQCGGPNRLTVFSSQANMTVIPPPKPNTAPGGGNWKYMGCLIDNTNQTRAFSNQLILHSNNTADTCLGQCAKYGFAAGGMEYGSECYCGDVREAKANGAVLAADTDCTQVCSGNPTEICGGGNRISYYNWVGPRPLYRWNYPTGIDAGKYELLIGGVVVPLVTIAGKNGKVTFLEKFGTGPPNSTGAYELDLSQVNNFTAAWRAMHVETDIFCSAALQLPDKAARQINIGGWSAPSTYGIRLYTPDGSPGVPGNNDWIENQNTLTLQNGRWYPSAMIMANGSILVAGGESGSNGPPVPTLEVLPMVGPVVYADWLNKTDPLNLYPYLAVLPSGGIFASYYNEARILNEKTFETIRSLPTMPGQVGQWQGGGRTYPLEGAFMLFPQYAPYTDPVRVLICGGSFTGAGGALDNCISIQPDVPGQEWVIERMPSRRVMPCMTPLPDGTYLILNGALSGEAGFGLATVPNLNAILYDPSKPVGSRMSVMANTTIARLYHSEAITLLDGRVLVSGSDPEDKINPEEYRVEVFVPPYLLSGLRRPNFTLASTDWAYGQTVTFIVTAGSTANLRVSLLGADASTHGNTMGQRTIFPEVKCTGQICKVVAPPNAYICPPGWFKMYVLDGPTPSWGQFVRIGGDPAGLGNWPQDPKFAPLPGV